MHITVYCPRCRSRYHLDPSMRGQRMRCPNTVCREVFEVQEEGSAPSTDVPAPRIREEQAPPQPDRAVEPPASAYSTGRVGDEIPLLPIEEEQAVPFLEKEEPADSVIPVLPAELVDDGRTDQPRETHSWDQPPPVRRTARAPVSTPKPVHVAPGSVEDEPPLQRPGRPARKEPRSWSPEASPPIPASEAPSPAVPFPPPGVPEDRWDLPPERRTSESAAVPASDVAVPMDDLAEGRSQRRRVFSLVALGLALLGLGVIGGGGWFLWSKFAATEETQHAEARRDYDEGKYGAAAQKFHQLEKAFPKSDNLGLYRFFAHLSEVRSDAGSLVDLGAALERLEGFAETHKDNPLLKDYGVDLWETAHKLLQGVIEKAREEKSRPLLDKAQEVLKLAESFRPDGVPPTRRHQAEADLTEVATGIARLEERQQLLEWARRLDPTPKNLELLREMLAAKKLDQDPEFKQVLVQKEDAVRLQVRYVAAPAELGLPAEPVEPCILVAPLVRESAKPPKPNGKVVLALVRGMLYGLDQGDGHVRWAMRVGIDTATLPVRLPATATSPEIFLVLSAERNTLRAVAAKSGKTLWEHRLSAPCLSRPTIIQRRAYVPTVNGRVEELEIIQGHQLGYFELPSQRLTVGGTWQPDTELLYVPGESKTVYVLDVNRKQCVTTIQTGHVSGSVRAAPVLVNRFDPGLRDIPENAPPAYLILCLADGLGAMKLRVFDVDPEQKLALRALKEKEEPRIRGWSWFPAYLDGEKLAFVTDAGVLGLYGINQYRNVDWALFHELREEFQLGETSPRPQRAQVVHAEENDFWVLANGQLQRLFLNRFAQKVQPVWPKALALGAPLHEGQVDETGKVLFVLTQAEHQQTSLATAVQAEDGQVLWQRQLGIESVGHPLSAGPDVMLLDHGGGVVALEPVTRRDLAGTDWLVGERLLARPIAEGLRWPQVTASPDGRSLTVVGVTALGNALVVRRYHKGDKDQKPALAEERIALRVPLAGPPAVGAEAILLPLANGSLSRILLGASPFRLQGGPTWRSERANEDAEGFVIWLNADEFLITDGLRGVRRRRWPVGDVQFPEVGRYPMPARISSVPLVLPNDQVCVADSQGGLTLLQGQQLKPVRSWQLGGRITAGPFLRGDRIGCVVERRRLVWIDPSESAPVWDYSTAGEPIVGQPQEIDKRLIVADQSGRFVALDPANGRPHGPGYTLKANVAPAASPAAFGSEYALVPLTDGTLFLLPLAKLGPQVPEFPWVL